MKHLIEDDKINLQFLLIGCLLLLPVIFFPVSADLSVFINGGNVIASGGELYNDFYDIKPPFLYYIFAAISYIFGESIIVFRLFDYFYQVSFLILSLYIFKKIGFESSVIRTFIIVFSITYPTLNHSNTLQAESLSFIPIFLYLYYSARENESSFIKTALIKGILLGIALSLKYTFGIILVADLLINFNKYGFKRSFYSGSLQFIAGMIFLGITFLPVFIRGNADGMINTFDYLFQYSAYPPFDLELLKVIYKKISNILGDNYSLLLTSLFFFSMYLVLKDKVSVKNKNYLDAAILFIIVLLISVVFERKIASIYRLVRIYPILILLSSIGLVYIFKNISINYKSVIVALFLLIFTPIPRYLNVLRTPFYYLTDKTKYYNLYTDEEPINSLHRQIKVSRYINSMNDDNFMLINTGGNQMIHYLDFNYKYSFPHSAFYLAKFSPEGFKEQFYNELNDANILCIQRDDGVEFIFFNKSNSYDMIMNDPIISDYIHQNFKQDTVLEDRYYIFVRNEAHKKR